MDVCVFVVVCNRFSAPRLSIVLAAPTLTKPNTHSQCPNGSNLNRHEKEVETIDGKTGYGVLCHRLNGLDVLDAKIPKGIMFHRFHRYTGTRGDATASQPALAAFHRQSDSIGHSKVYCSVQAISLSADSRA